MKNLLICLIVNISFATSVAAAQNTNFSTESFLCTVENEAQDAFQYFLYEVEHDAILTLEEQQDKVAEFQLFAASLSPKVASRVTSLLIQETRSRILEILQNAAIEQDEIETYLSDYEEIVQIERNKNVEFVRQMLFFVAELKIHRQYVHDFGVALGCSSKQLLHHDLCKLSLEQFEGYARFFRGGRKEEDKAGYQASWARHQHEEHHLESYTKEGVNFDSFSDDRLRNNMRESVADWLAASKQRGHGTVIYYLVNIFPKKNFHLGLIPYLEEALITAHGLYLQSKENPNSIFNGFPCWNSDVEAAFNQLKTAS